MYKLLDKCRFFGIRRKLRKEDRNVLFLEGKYVFTKKNQQKQLQGPETNDISEI